MASARLTITIPEDVWIGELSREHPEAEFEILAAFPKDPGGVALAEISAPDPDPVVLALESYEDVTGVEPLQRTGDSVLVQFETSSPVLLLPVTEAGTPLELPFSVQDGRVDWEVTATRERLSELAEQLRAFGIGFDVKSVTRRVEPSQLLTAKQSEVVGRAVELGYYDTPREATLTDLADDLGIAKSTCSETLHRAEEKIVKQFVADVDGIDAEPSITIPS